MRQHVSDRGMLKPHTLCRKNVENSNSSKNKELAMRHIYFLELYIAGNVTLIFGSTQEVSLNYCSLSQVYWSSVLSPAGMYIKRDFSFLFQLKATPFDAILTPSYNAFVSIKLKWNFSSRLFSFFLVKQSANPRPFPRPVKLHLAINGFFIFNVNTVFPIFRLAN